MSSIGVVDGNGDLSITQVQKPRFGMGQNLSAIFKYESYKGNRTIRSFLWNLDTKPN